MPFPFVPGGVVLAIGVLAGALALFGLALRAIDRASAAGRETVLPGLVSGFRTWTSGRARTAATPSPDAATRPPAPADSPRPELVELVDRPIRDRD